MISGTRVFINKYPFGGLLYKILSYGSLFFLLFLVNHLPKPFAEKVRAKAVDTFSPFYCFSKNLGASLSSSKPSTKFRILEEEKHRLEVENHNLRSQLNAVYEWLVFDARLEEQTKRIQTLKEKDSFKGDIYWREFFQKRSEELKNLLKMKIQALSARVIYREPSSWGSSIWINVGSKNNQALEREIVAVNSPVIVGNHLIGVVEQVEEEKSRVRLITDSGLVPSVRACRGKPQDRELLELVEALLLRLRARKDLDEEAVFFAESMKSLLPISEKSSFLAKGEIRGASLGVWHKNQTLLQGIGFNYNYADEKGEAKDLSGNFLASTDKKSLEPIIDSGDLLVTTGMDGVFPEGLFVAFVTKVHPLNPGDYFYRLEAKPTCPNFEEVDSVFVIPHLEGASL